MSIRTRIKVCGITNKSEAQRIVALGVDALGFICVESSPRNIDPEKVKEIVATLPPFVDAVGVFVDQDPNVVDEIAQYCGLTFVQLHGSESVEYCKSIGRRVLKAMSVRPGMEADILTPYAGCVNGFLLDTYHEKMAGGSGETFDWKLLEKLDIPAPYILAGGLSPENVGAAITQVRPFAVDVNSGVEIEPGVKDIEKVRCLVEEVTKADRAVIEE
ncbi:MAG: phosphoribosylanthranilate isomerase [Proteobacteria bacterium]|nr:phosphoribosylanthranilate isomerase [Pseudomonadota bacterium]MBU1717186.1 phosphoribosylanthranilate isomerase [Pseudomonadota bacterium]